MLNQHPEQYFSAAFLIISLLNLMVVATLIASKSWRSQRAARLERRLKSATAKLEASQPSNQRTLVRLRLFELRLLAQALLTDGQTTKLERLSQHLQQQARLEHLLEIAWDGRLWQRIDAIALMGYLRHARALPALRRALRDPRQEIVLAAIKALGTWGSSEAAEALFSILHRECPVNPSRVATAIENCQRDIVDLLCRKAQSNDPTTQFWATTLLGGHALPQAQEALRRNASHHDANIRAATFASMGKIGDGRSGKHLVAGLRDEIWFVRAHAATACGEQHITEAVSEIAALLADKEWWVRSAARESLVKMGSASLPELLGCLQNRDRFVRNQAAEALENMGYLDHLVWDLSAGEEKRDEAFAVLSAVRKAEGGQNLAEKLKRVSPEVARRYHETLALGA
jgi:HEAT repeat protein